MTQPIKFVVFDVGETLVDETRYWAEWADFIGVPRLTFMAVLGAIIVEGRHHREVFRRFRPDAEYAELYRRREASGWRYELRPDDFYPDAVPGLRALKAAGFKVGVVGNQPSACEASLKRLDIGLDLVGSSEAWGVEKPSAAFFERLIAEAGVTASAIAYVGDRPDNDVAAAKRSGLTSIFIKRGPWAWLHAAAPEAAMADLQVDDLDQLARHLLERR